MTPFSRIDLDDIIDARKAGNEIHLITRDGRLIRLPFNDATLDIYWKVKIRNRRRAFGL